MTDELLNLAESNPADADALAALNAGGRFRIASSVEMLAWATAGGRLVRLEAAVAAALPAANDPAYGLAVVVKSALKGFLLLIQRTDTAFDRNLPDRAQLLSAVVAMGVLAPQDIADLDAVTPREPSPAVRLLGHAATAEDLTEIRRRVAARAAYKARLTALSDWYAARIAEADAWRDGGYAGARPAVAAFAE